jgi:transcription termination factor Rho
MSQVSQVATLEGILHFKDDRSDGQLRDPLHPLRVLSGGIFVSRQLIKEFNLRPGLMVKGQPKGRHLTRLHSVEGFAPAEYAERTHIYEGIAVDPHPMLKLEHDPNETTTRMIDILTPVGFGQRGLIVAPPRTVMTILLQNIA